jgi:hypothetical protein
MITEQDIVERLRNHVNHRNGPSLLNGAWQMMLEAADEIANLRAERDDWKGAAECNDAFLQMAKEGHPITIVPPHGASAAAREMRERCAKVAENPGFIEAQDTDWDLGVNYAKSFIAKAIRALPDTSSAIATNRLTSGDTK